MGSVDKGSGEIRIAIVPADNFYGKESDAWRGELVEIDRLIRREMPDAVESAPGGKGDLSTAQVIVDLASSGAVIAMFGCIKAWIQAHPGRRRLHLKWSQGGSNKSVTVDASNVDDSVVKAAVTEAVKRSS